MGAAVGTAEAQPNVQAGAGKGSNGGWVTGQEVTKAKMATLQHGRGRGDTQGPGGGGNDRSDGITTSSAPTTAAAPATPRGAAGTTVGAAKTTGVVASTTGEGRLDGTATAPKRGATWSEQMKGEGGAAMSAAPAAAAAADRLDDMAAATESAHGHDGRASQMPGVGRPPRRQRGTAARRRSGAAAATARQRQRSGGARRRRRNTGLVTATRGG